MKESLGKGGRVTFGAGNLRAQWVENKREEVVSQQAYTCVPGND